MPTLKMNNNKYSTDITNGLDKFKRFTSHTPTEKLDTGLLYGVIYTRVSSKDQFDKNGSLESQQKMCTALAERYNIPVVERFGGTYESAKTEERKEFQRMMKFINSSKKAIRYILVSDNDRFSRTGGNAIYLAGNLRKQGVQILAASSPIDTSNATGAFQQDMQLLFSYYDNQQRKEKTIRGMKQKYQKGVFFGRPPVGYDVIKNNGQTTIVINAQGKLLAKAFKWKAEKQYPTNVIGQKLRVLGVKVSDKHLSRLFRNVFYCGLLSNKMLGQEIVEGQNWPALVSKEVFLKANEVLENARTKYETRTKDSSLPLKQVIKCDKCEKPITGYVVRKKGLYYYKCGTISCCSNKSAKHMNAKFFDFLEEFKINPNLQPLIKQQLIAIVKNSIVEKVSDKEDLDSQVKKLNNSILRLEQRFLNEDIDKDFYEKYRAEYVQQLQSLLEKRQGTSSRLSNLETILQKCFERSQNINKIWQSGDIVEKQRLVKQLFNDDIYYNVQNDTYRTNYKNSIVSYFAQGARILESSKTKNAQLLAEHSPLVARRGIEPLLPE